MTPLTRSQIMARIKGKGTKLELRGMEMLRKAGIDGFVEQHLVRIGNEKFRTDLAWPELKLAVYFDSCFWHRCPIHFRMPKTNLDFWIPKIKRDDARSVFTNETLREAGWTVVRIWECDFSTLVDKVGTALAERKSDGKHDLEPRYERIAYRVSRKV